MDIGVLVASMVKIFALPCRCGKKYTHRDERFVKYKIVKAKRMFLSSSCNSPSTRIQENSEEESFGEARAAG